jgi:hypothetical protein
MAPWKTFEEVVGFFGINYHTIFSNGGTGQVPPVAFSECTAHRERRRHAKDAVVTPAPSGGSATLTL